MRPALAVLLLLAPLTLPAAPQSRRARQQAARQRIEAARLRQTAIANMRLHAYVSAARAYRSLLQLDPNNAEARRGLALALADACRADVHNFTAQEKFAAAASTLAACPAPPGDAAGVAHSAAAALALLRPLARVDTALDARDWPAAARALAVLPRAPWPAALAQPLATTLAPAYAPLAGAANLAAARAAANSARALAHRTPALAPRAAVFAAFLRNRARRRALTAALTPALVLYLLVLAASFVFGLRRVYATSDSGASPALPPAEAA